MKNTISFLFLFVAAGLLIGLSSCRKKDNFTGASTLKPTSPTGTKTLPDNVQMVETDTTIQYMIQLSEPQVVDIKIKVKLMDGATATEGEDFDFSHEIYIPAYETAGVGEVKIYRDAMPEDQESFTLQIGDNSTANVDFPPQNVTFTLDNWVSANMTLTFDWGGKVDLDGTQVELCDSVDLDFYLMTVADTSDTQVYSAATGACPESISTADFPGDPEYYMWVNLYENHVRPSSGTIEFPVIITAERLGSANVETFSAPADALITSDDPDYAIDGGFVFRNVIKVVRNSDGTFDIINPYDDSVLVDNF